MQDRVPELWLVDWPTEPGSQFFGLIVIDGRVFEAPSAARWAEGKSIEAVRSVLESRGARCERAI